MTPLNVGHVIAADPGKNKVYGAQGRNGKLVELHTFDPEKQNDFVARCDLFVLERMNINRNTPNWQSVLDAERAGQRVAGRHRCHVVEHTAAQWKGFVKKPVHHLRLWHVMTDEERALFPAHTFNTIQLACENIARTGLVVGYSFETHNHLDAAALLMFEYRRLGRGGKRLRK